MKIELLIRGINCLHSGIEGLTDNIEVHSIVGRFLEHSRIYIFGTPDRDEIYIASADFMTRNTLRRVEVAAPIYDEKLKLRIREMFVTMFSDNIKGRIQQPDGSYLIPAETDTRLESQECSVRRLTIRMSQSFPLMVFRQLRRRSEWTRSC